MKGVVGGALICGVSHFRFSVKEEYSREMVNQGLHGFVYWQMTGKQNGNRCRDEEIEGRIG